MSSALLSVLALGASACASDSDDKPSAGVPASSLPASSAPSTPAASSAPAAAPLSAGQLKSALLTAKDLPTDYRATTPKSDEDILGQTATATPAVCQPIQDMGAGEKSVRPTAAANQNYSQKSKPFVKVFGRIAAYAPGEAEKAMADLKAAAKACPAYTFKDEADGTAGKALVKSLQPLSLGDDAVTLELTVTSDGDSMVLPFTQIRVGSTIALFATMDVMKLDRAVEFPHELLAKQVEKLKAATAG
ncbi:hypothetical protein [Streptomyces sp. NPDC020983]|uniref:hypothetical protein n=1 Tax=Streptomyces sp. NPDC020983 TaxID=3365106 RepID=UPI00379A198B